MAQYLMEWAHGTFQVMTGEQLKKELDEWSINWRKAPRPLYRLIPGQAPKRCNVIQRKDYWYLEDDFRNHLMIL